VCRSKFQNHPHIEELIASHRKALQLVIKREHTDLSRIYQTLNWDDAIHVVSCIAKAALEIHRNNYTHRNIKLENILVCSSPRMLR
jgi:serine/threonine protein kinase